LADRIAGAPFKEITVSETTATRSALRESKQLPTPDGMLNSMLRIMATAAFGSFLILIALPAAIWVKHSVFRQGPGAVDRWSAGFLFTGSCLVVVAAAAAIMAYRLVVKFQPFLDEDAARESQLLNNLDAKYIDIAIAGAAALSLFLELALIRWQASVLEFLAFYKNFSLLACFAGLGLGYALANRSRVPLIFVAPLLTWQFVLMMAARAFPFVFQVIPFREQLSMGVGRGSWDHVIALYILLTLVFLLSAAMFIPIGQLCGRLMERRSKLRAYGLNLAGSIMGVVLMLGISFLWTPPLVWFTLCLGGILVFSIPRPVSLYTGIAFTLIAVVALAWWPVDRLWNKVYSPYQLLEIGTSPDTGLTLIRAAGHYYQRIHNLADANLTGPMREFRDYYDFPYKAHPRLNDVAIVGAGTGNDVAAALRGGTKRADAIEIDPGILELGRDDHPEMPYSNPAVHAIVNDARSFLRNTQRKYDLIVYGLLDSHVLLTQGASVRLDSYVYTIEGLREARNRLKPDGAISLSFAVISDELGRKIYLMLQQVFDGRGPLCVKANDVGAVIFLESNDPTFSISPQLITNSGFADVTALYSNPKLQADVSTDDWPFFYMPRRVYPVSYVAMIALIIILSAALGANFLGEAPSFSHLSFFFLGAGFMLIETKGITEMGLTFGNTWQVIGVVIVGILTMAFIGNCLVAWLNIKRPYVGYGLLLAAVAAGWFVAKSGGFASTPLGRLETIVVLTGPLLFSGIVFSTLLTAEGKVSSMMAMNLLGAICGGLLEYNSMYFGFRWLYLAAMGCYIMAFVSDLALTRTAAKQRAVLPEHG
jgi:hypothetical protein